MKRIILVIFTLAIFVGVNAATSKSDTLKKAMIEKNEMSISSTEDTILMKKLTANQIMKLEEQKLELELQRVIAESKSDVPISGFGIVLISLAPFLLVGVLLYMSIQHKNRESARKYELYSKSLEMGQNIPDHFFDEPKKASGNSNLKKGILWSMIGVAIVISFLIIGKYNALIVGIIPAFLGFGYLLVHWLDKPKSNETELKNE